MNIKRESRTQLDIAQIIRALDIKDEICQRYSSCCDCPLCELGVFDAPTCREIAKVKSRLELVYKVVETL